MYLVSKHIQAFLMLFTTKISMGKTFAVQQKYHSCKENCVIKATEVNFYNSAKSMKNTKEFSPQKFSSVHMAYKQA